MIIFPLSSSKALKPKIFWWLCPWATPHPLPSSKVEVVGSDPAYRHRVILFIKNKTPNTSKHRRGLHYSCLYGSLQFYKSGTLVLPELFSFG